MSLQLELSLLANTTFSVIDFETTGTDPQVDRITEVGVVKVRGGEVLKTISSFVKQQRRIPPAITGLTGITNEMLLSAPSEESVIEAIHDVTEDSVIVGHNVSFDLGFLKAAYERVGYELKNTRIDTLALSRKLLSGEVANFKLSTLSHYLRLDHQPTHRAFDDALATVELLHVLIERAGTYGCTHIEELSRLSKIDLASVGSKLGITTKLPHLPGVYLFKDSNGKVIYIGKATDLKARVRSYFHSDTRHKTPKMLKQVATIDAMTFKTETEAAVAEARLIQKQKPHFNKVYVNPNSYVFLVNNPGLKVVVGEVLPPWDGSGNSPGLLGPIRSKTQARLCIGGLSFAGTTLNAINNSSFGISSLFAEGTLMELHLKTVSEIDRLARSRRFEEAELRRQAATTTYSLALRQLELGWLMASASGIKIGDSVVENGVLTDLTPTWTTSDIVPLKLDLGIDDAPKGLTRERLDEMCILLGHLKSEGAKWTETICRGNEIQRLLKELTVALTPRGSATDIYEQ
ncbi:MAG: GIY-YIG nuclease family protein [Acidimicrobiaceae bacterium]|nr:GIY-YIG nuclease family protein [Acidimicrobiaceae bacterium]